MHRQIVFEWFKNDEVLDSWALGERKRTGNRNYNGCRNG
jgi:hypothetical protein